MEAMEDENTRIGEGIPGLESEIERLKQGLVDAQRKTKMIESYKQADPETTVSNRWSALTQNWYQNALSTKAMVAKLSGFAKFDVDIKLTCDQFILLMNNLCLTDAGFNDEKLDELLDVMNKAFVEGTAPYTGDLENETYKAIL